jgi:hypothetical protein
MLQDIAMFSEHVTEETDSAIEPLKTMCVEQVTRAATTRLEFIMIENIVMHGSALKGRENVLAAERRYSTRFRLEKKEHVHPSVLKKRNETWK